MHSMRLRRVGALMFAAAFALGACAGAPAGASTSDPVGSVQSAFAAVSSGGLTKLGDFACAAKKDDILSAFGGSGMGALTQAGVNPDDLFGAIGMSFANLNVTQTAKADTTATVHVTGDSTITLDKDKMRSIMKTVLAAQGQAADDATLDTVMNMMASQLTQTQKVDQTMNLVNEGGKWLLCA